MLTPLEGGFRLSLCQYNGLFEGVALPLVSVNRASDMA